MKEIRLTQGLVALVDDQEFERLSKYRWHVKRTRHTAYARRCGSPPTYLHHEVLPLVPGLQVDHANGDGLDCRRINLRYATISEQRRNSRTKRPHGTSRHKGVTWDPRGFWRATLKRGGKRWVRVSATEDGAARLYDALAIREFGEFARLNFPDGIAGPISQ